MKVFCTLHPLYFHHPLQIGEKESHSIVSSTHGICAVCDSIVRLDIETTRVEMQTDLLMEAAREIRAE